MLLIGVVSFYPVMTNEWARAITGSFLATQGICGVIFIGDFINLFQVSALILDFNVKYKTVIYELA